MIDLYPWFALVSSVLITGLFAAHVIDSARSRLTRHDDRSAYELLIALTLLIASVGLCISAVASFIGPLGVDVAIRQELRNLGLAMVRGVLFVTACVFLVADRVPHAEGAR